MIASAISLIKKAEQEWDGIGGAGHKIEGVEGESSNETSKMWPVIASVSSLRKKEQERYRIGGAGNIIEGVEGESSNEMSEKRAMFASASSLGKKEIDVWFLFWLEQEWDGIGGAGNKIEGMEGESSNETSKMRPMIASSSSFRKSEQERYRIGGAGNKIEGVDGESSNETSEKRPIFASTSSFREKDVWFLFWLEQEWDGIGGAGNKIEGVEGESSNETSKMWPMIASASSLRKKEQERYRIGGAGDKIDGVEGESSNEMSEKGAMFASVSSLRKKEIYVWFPFWLERERDRICGAGNKIEGVEGEGSNETSKMRPMIASARSLIKNEQERYRIGGAGNKIGGVEGKSSNETSEKRAVIVSAKSLIRKAVSPLGLIETSSDEELEKAEEEEEWVVGDCQKHQSRLFLMQGGWGLEKAPKEEEWVKAEEIHLMDNELSELPEKPMCPILSVLFLQRNYKLRKIPPSFFEHMPALQVLNLSKTGIESLPESLFGLVGLKRLFLNGCDNFMMLSPNVGKLECLEVLDLEGTEIIDLPKEVKELTNLTCLEVSFYGDINHARKNEQSNVMIHGGVLSALSQLEELNIDVNPDDERWDMSVEAFVNEVCDLKKLNSLKFYFPRVELLSRFISYGLAYSPFLHFRFIVGHDFKRVISPLSCDVQFELERWDRCLKYINGEGVPKVIKRVLQCATAFHLDRHMTVTRLSEFGIENMELLKCCILGECNEIQVIIDGEDVHEEYYDSKIVCEPYDERIGLESLEYLNIYYMKNLRRIWKGPVHKRCFSLLKSLTLRTCPQLTTVFTLCLLENLYNLEELKVDDCPAIKSLLSCESSAKREASSSKLDYFLPKLKKVSLYYVPELVSISGDERIAPKLEWLSFYDCPKLKSLSIQEVSSTDLKRIKGERDWWEALEWRNGKPDNLDGIFVPVEEDTFDWGY